MMHRRHWDEAMVLAVGYGYEQATKHRVPPPSFPECTEAEPYIPYSEVGSPDMWTRSWHPAAGTVAASSDPAALEQLHASSSNGSLDLMIIMDCPGFQARCQQPAACG